MSDWSLTKLLSGLHDDIEQKLGIARGALHHAVSKGDGAEAVWIELFKEYLPMRYQTEKAFVVDSEGNVSEQIDVVIFDRQYTPFIFKFKDQFYIPAESVYAVFESKQSVDAEHIAYARKKLKSVKALKRTSLPIPTASGIIPPKPLIPIHGGILTFESDWKPGMGSSLLKALIGGSKDDALELGCVAAHGFFKRDHSQEKDLDKKLSYTFDTEGKHATGFLFELIERLQFSGTVPMIEIKAYANWISPKKNEH